ncbi:MAG: hypothetical protein HDQ93_00250 [Desulfovibrio sp.]|nr:hypothetical protein [Desulfovibrio sp.]
MISDSRIKGAWPFLALFLVCFAIFYGRLWLLDLAEEKTRNLVRIARENNANITGLNISWFPPVAKIASIETKVGGAPLILENINIPLRFFPLGAEASAKILGGNLKIDAGLEAGWPPRISRIDFSLVDIELATLNNIPDLKIFVDIQGGKASALGDIEFAWKNSRPDWTKTAGGITVKADNGALSLKIPILNNDRLDNIRGDAALKIAGTTLELTRCGLASPPFAFEATGSLAPWIHPSSARVNLETETRIPADAVNASLIPKRTMEQINRRGMVRAKIAGTIADPKIYLEN